MWISIIHLNFNILVVLDAIIMVYAVSANISDITCEKIYGMKIKTKEMQSSFQNTDEYS